MRDYKHIIGTFTSVPWMITADALDLMLEIFNAHLNGTVSEEQIRIRMADVKPRTKYQQRADRVGILQIDGPIFPKANMFTEMSGGTDLETFRQEFRAMQEDDSIGAIMLNVDSPGGSSAGLQEMMEELRSAGKPLYALANNAANSAAYGLASQAQTMFATPSAQVGSVGTYTVHMDRTGQDEQRGLKKTVIKAGRLKAINEEPLSEEGHAAMQSYVDAVNDEFVDSIAKGRNVSVDHVNSHFGEGMVLTSRQALDVGAIDGIATFDQAIAHIGGELQANTPVSVSMSGAQVTNVTSTNPLITNINWVSSSTSNSYDADKEHSEPGTGLGGEPQPATPPEEGDPAIEGGWRRDPPPPAYETEESAVNRTWLEERASALGVEFDENTTDEDLAQFVAAAMDEIVVPLSTATQAAAAQRAWREDYPDQAAQLDRLLAESQVNQAHAFADQYRQLEGGRGCTPQVRELIEQAHLAVATRSFTQDNLQELLTAAFNPASTVPFGEVGASRGRDGDETVAPSSDFRTARQQFADLVQARMAEDNMDQDKAIAAVSQENPALAEAYLHGHV